MDNFLYYAFALAALVIGIVVFQEGCHLRDQDGGRLHYGFGAPGHLLALHFMMKIL